MTAIDTSVVVAAFASWLAAGDEPGAEGERRLDDAHLAYDSDSLLIEVAERAH